MQLNTIWKQTAVEWLYDKIKSRFEHDRDLFESFMTTISIAKLKEREQIIEAAADHCYPTAQIALNDAEIYYEQHYGKCTPQS